MVCILPAGSDASASAAAALVAFARTILNCLPALTTSRLKADYDVNQLELNVLVVVATTVHGRLVIELEAWQPAYPQDCRRRSWQQLSYLHSFVTSFTVAWRCLESADVLCTPTIRRL